ncbi:MAG: hypothetical protein AB7N76_25940 [Planctomycetota bacterium]
MLAYADLPTPFDAWLRREFLYDLDPAQAGERVPVRVFGVSSYRESVPTFNVVSHREGGTFHALPPHALLLREDAAPLPLEAICYHDCPDEHVAAFEVGLYKELGTCQVFLPAADGARAPRPGRYLFSLDWYRDNLLVHGIALEGGQLCLYPPHKVLFPLEGADLSRLPDWKKLHTDWSVGR